MWGEGRRDAARGRGLAQVDGRDLRHGLIARDGAMAGRQGEADDQRDQCGGDNENTNRHGGIPFAVMDPG